jgi:hypothetical protein
MMLSKNFSFGIEEERGEQSPSGKSWTKLSELMRGKKASKVRIKPKREPFITIDDLVKKAQELTAGLRVLGEYKYPLDIRRGIRKGVISNMTGKEETMQVKAGGRTYFLDLKKTKDDKPFLVITESRFKGEGEGRERNTIMVFPENAEEFSNAVSKMTAKLG